MKYCPECWKTYESGAVCPECGAKLCQNKHIQDQSIDAFIIDGGYLSKAYRSEIPYGVIGVGKACAAYEKFEEIVLPNTVKFIGRQAFKQNTAKRVVIPSSVTHIDDEAFAYCGQLTDVKLPGVRRLGSGAFSWCGALKSVTIGDSIVHIAAGAFSCSRNLESVTIGKGLKKIKEGAFYDCNKLTSINFGGTKAQWHAVFIQKGWRERSAITRIQCSDGILTY